MGGQLGKDAPAGAFPVPAPYRRKVQSLLARTVCKLIRNPMPVNILPEVALFTPLDVDVFVAFLASFPSPTLFFGEDVFESFTLDRAVFLAGEEDFFNSFFFLSFSPSVLALFSSTLRASGSTMQTSRLSEDGAKSLNATGGGSACL